MYIHISNIKETLNLQQYINNRNHEKKVGLKSIRYGIGWHNVHGDFIKLPNKGKTNLPNGYYSFDQLVDEFKKENIDLSVNETNCIASLRSSDEIRISRDLRNMLGFYHKNKFEPNETHSGNKFVDVAIYKSLYVHLEQISASENVLDGKQSTLLAVVPVKNKCFGEYTYMRFEQPDYKYLATGDIFELKIEIKDDKGKEIKNVFPVSCDLEVV